MVNLHGNIQIGEDGRSCNDTHGFMPSSAVLHILRTYVKKEFVRQPSSFDADGAYVFENIERVIYRVIEYEQPFDDPFNLYATYYADTLVGRVKAFSEVYLDLNFWLGGALGSFVVLGLHRNFWKTDGKVLYNDKCGEY